MCQQVSIEAPSVLKCSVAGKVGTIDACRWRGACQSCWIESGRLLPGKEHRRHQGSLSCNLSNALKEAYESARSRCGEGSPSRDLSKGQRCEVSPGISRQSEAGDPPRGQGHSKELFLIVKEMCSRKFLSAFQRNHIGSIDRMYQLQNL